MTAGAALAADHSGNPSSKAVNEDANHPAEPGANAKALEQIPEPTYAAMIGLGGTLILLKRRRSRQG